MIGFSAFLRSNNASYSLRVISSEMTNKIKSASSAIFRDIISRSLPSISSNPGVSINSTLTSPLGGVQQTD